MPPSPVGLAGLNPVKLLKVANVAFDMYSNAEVDPAGFQITSPKFEPVTFSRLVVL